MLHLVNVVQGKKSARTLEKFLGRLGIQLKHGQALDAIAAMFGVQNWAALSDQLSEEAINRRLSPVALLHIEDNRSNRYGEEQVIVAHNGFQLRYDVEEELLTYVRICDPLGREIAYWVSDEWADDPQLVMGAILGALAQGGALMPEQLGKNAPVAFAEPSIHDIPFSTVSSIKVNQESYTVWFREDDLLKELDNLPSDVEAEFDVHHVVLRCHGEHFREMALTLGALRMLKWNAAADAFVSENGDYFEFFLEHKFRPGVSQPQA